MKFLTHISFNLIIFINKTQQIIPLHKKGPKTNPENFRPISLTSNIIKLFERILRKKLVQYFESNQLINPNQHGFRKGHNCSTQLLTHTCNLMSCLVNGNEVDSIYIDYAKAFDKVDHNLLLQKLEDYGVTGKYKVWLENFLKGRTQVVRVNGACSYPTSVDSGVPQGSVLGPLLFIIFINDLSHSINHSNILTFADDTKLVKEICESSDTFLLQEDLNNVVEWSVKNKMQLNAEKFEFVSHKPNKNHKLCLMKELPFSQIFNVYNVSNKHTISHSPSVRDLGIMISSDLSWDEHIQNICKKAKQVSAWALKVFYTRSKEVLLTLYSSLIRPLLEYCPEVWNPYKIKDIANVEQIQRTFTSKISTSKDLNYWERLVEFNMSSLQRRRERAIIIIVWKIKHGLYPNHMKIEFKTHTRTNSIRAVLKSLPKVAGSLLSKFEESFVIKAAKLWNLLPSDVTHLTELFAFKAGLDKFLKNTPDLPPISGYPYQHNNSLLSYHQLKSR